MKLTKFRVRNFRSINDSGEITTDNLTAILGRNESGKSNILLALQHLNPPSGMTKIEAIKNFPRHRRLAEQNDDTEFLDTEWSLSPKEQEELGAIYPRASEVSTVTITRRYGKQRLIGFIGIESQSLDVRAINRLIDKIVTLLDTLKTDETAPNVELVLQEISAFRATNGQSVHSWLDAVVSKYEEAFRTAAQYTLEKQDDYLDLKEDFADIVTALNDREQEEKALSYIIKCLPVFVYIDEYPHLDGHQNLSQLAYNQQNNALSDKDKGFIKLCKVADIDPFKLQELTAEPETRNQLVNRAGAVVTREIRRLWTDRELKVRFNLDGSYFDTYISDPTSTYDVEVNLNERSRGFKWFFSFYITFFADTHGGDAENAIILLDEPGLYLHAKSQSDLLKHLDEDFSNQIIYTTHSPFLVPTKQLSTVKTVNICQEKGTTVTNDPTGDSTTLFPLQAALGYEVSQSLFIGSNNLVVEGVTDFWYLSSMSEYLKSLGRTGLLNKITITPAGGAQKIPYLVSLLSAQHLNLLVLLDHEKDALATKADLLANHRLSKRNVILVSEATDSEVSELDIEDLLGSEYFLSLAEEAYKEEISDKLTYNMNIPRVCKRFEKAMKDSGINRQFVKAKPARVFMNRLSEGCADSLPEEVITNFETLFKLINKQLK
ncbi:ATP-binding protein [Vibrio tubiashii]|uniref:AAA family ATPase n=1 Tax=Vibrio tubiashii TaxID=29498 RepID=UPI001EFC4D66|nr:AAA family ATPase [Vibrio tubiashii]MCG9575361.1 ATP-binding protein [Vibrio tubiashii]